MSLEERIAKLEQNARVEVFPERRDNWYLMELKV